eukprot:comp19756_c0_seq3/m.23609 comp19756_c0_seq3/g.23609  ORF comp19756_c0_seq3/g.23609 comp19756_c0_seq3/m.23609 type:complete len:316 (-) comp19756_c0_seq3:434-1381(-)
MSVRSLLLASGLLALTHALPTNAAPTSSSTKVTTPTTTGYLIKSVSTGKCIVSESADYDSSNPKLGDCASQDVYVVYMNATQLQTKVGRCFSMESGDQTASGQSISYFVGCSYEDSEYFPLKNRQFKLPAATGGPLQILGENSCLEAIPNPAEGTPDNLFLPCVPSKPEQQWMLVPFDPSAMCYVPSRVGDIGQSDDDNESTKLTSFTFEWMSIPEHVDTNEDYTVTLCLTSFPTINGETVPTPQCVTRKNWSALTFAVSVPTETSNCRYHFDVTYGNKCGIGQTEQTVFGCVGRSCPKICNTKGSQPAVDFPQK